MFPIIAVAQKHLYVCVFCIAFEMYWHNVFSPQATVTGRSQEVNVSIKTVLHSHANYHLRWRERIWREAESSVRPVFLANVVGQSDERGGSVWLGRGLTTFWNFHILIKTQLIQIHISLFFLIWQSGDVVGRSVCSVSVPLSVFPQSHHFLQMVQFFRFFFHFLIPLFL